MFPPYLVLLVPFLFFGTFAILALCASVFEKRLVRYFVSAESDSAQDCPIRSGAPEQLVGTDSNGQRRVINPYEVTAGADEFPESSVVSHWCQELKRSNYRYQGQFRHAKGGIYQIRYDVWLSADRQILAMACSGILLVPVKNLGMLSLYRDSQTTIQASQACLHSITAEASYTPDPSGITRTMLFLDADVGEMERLHRQRMAEVDVIPFRDAPLSEFWEFRQSCADRMEDSGWVRFVDESRNAWRPSILTALWIWMDTYRFQLGRRFYSDRRRLQRRATRN